MTHERLERRFDEREEREERMAKHARRITPWYAVHACPTCGAAILARDTHCTTHRPEVAR